MNDGRYGLPVPAVSRETGGCPAWMDWRASYCGFGCMNFA